MRRSGSWGGPIVVLLLVLGACTSTPDPAVPAGGPAPGTPPGATAATAPTPALPPATLAALAIPPTAVTLPAPPATAPPGAAPTADVPATLPTLPPGPAVQVRTQFYTETYRLLADSCPAAADFMHTNGPGGWPAETRLTFEFSTPPVTLHFQPVDSSGQVCTKTRPDAAQTILTFTLRITLPEWDALGQTGCLGAAREWQQVHDALVVHEHGHADRYQARFDEWAAKVGGRLAAAQIAACGLTTADATASAQQQLDALVHGISDQLQGEIADDPEQIRYEQETQHGIRQGAVFHADACRCAP